MGMWAEGVVWNEQLGILLWWRHCCQASKRCQGSVREFQWTVVEEQW